jgi:hypothetical protein
VDPPTPPAWDAAFDGVQRDEREMEEYLVGAGLEPRGIWIESRVRRSTVEATSSGYARWQATSLSAR